MENEVSEVVMENAEALYAMTNELLDAPAFGKLRHALINAPNERAGAFYVDELDSKMAKVHEYLFKLKITLKVIKNKAEEGYYDKERRD